MRIDAENNIPASAPITTIGTSAGNILLPSKADATVSSSPGLHTYIYAIDESHRTGEDISGLFSSIDADLLAGFVLALELDYTVYLRKQGVVFSEPHIDAWVEFRSTLSNQDVAGTNHFTGEAFHTSALGPAVPSVIGTSTRFLVSHTLTSFPTARSIGP